MKDTALELRGFVLKGHGFSRAATGISDEALASEGIRLCSNRKFPHSKGC